MSAARAFPVRWIPAYAGMTNLGFDAPRPSHEAYGHILSFVTPAKAGAQREKERAKRSI